MTHDMKARFSQKMTEAEKQIFAAKVFEVKKSNPDVSWVDALNAGRAAFPDQETLPATVIHPSSYPWLIRALTALGEQAGIDLFPVKVKRAPRGTGKITPKLAAKQEKQNLIAKTIYEIRRNHPELTWANVFLRANERLPDDMKLSKGSNSPAQHPWLARLLDELTANEKTNIKVAVADVKTEEASDPEPERADLKPAPTQINMDRQDKQDKTVIPESSAATDPAALSLEAALINAIVSTIQPIVLGIIQSPQFAIGLQQAFRNIATTPAASLSSHPVISRALEQNVEPKKKVMIVGLQPIQAQEIQNEWGKVYDLRMFDSNVTSDKIKSNLPTCERAIIMTKFISHSTMDVMRGHAGFTYCNGGVTALKEILNRRTA